MHNQLKSNDFLLKVAYLGDFFSEVNSLNLTLQGVVNGCIRHTTKLQPSNIKWNCLKD